MVQRGTTPSFAVRLARRSLWGWRQPWWKPAVGIPLYVLSGLLVLAGLESSPSTALHGVELLIVALLAADAWNVRSRAPVLNSADKAVAAGGWVLLIGVLLGLMVLR